MVRRDGFGLGPITLTRGHIALFGLFVVGLSVGLIIASMVIGKPRVSTNEYITMVARIYDREASLPLAIQRLQLVGIDNPTESVSSLATGLDSAVTQPGRNTSTPAAAADLQSVRKLDTALRANSGAPVQGPATQTGSRPLWLLVLIVIIMGLTISAVVVLRLFGAKLALPKVELVIPVVLMGLLSRFANPKGRRKPQREPPARPTKPAPRQSTFTSAISIRPFPSSNGNTDAAETALGLNSKAQVQSDELDFSQSATTTAYQSAENTIAALANNESEPQRSEGYATTTTFAPEIEIDAITRASGDNGSTQRHTPGGLASVHARPAASRRPSGKRPFTYRSSYVFGDEPYDEIHPIFDDRTRTMIGACGVSASLQFESEGAARYWAFRAWVSDYNLKSEDMYHKEILHAVGLVSPWAYEHLTTEIEEWLGTGEVDEVRMIESGAPILLETDNLSTELTIDSFSCVEDEPADAYFDKISSRFDVVRTSRDENEDATAIA